MNLIPFQLAVCKAQNFNGGGFSGWKDNNHRLAGALSSLLDSRPWFLFTKDENPTPFFLRFTTAVDLARLVLPIVVHLDGPGISNLSALERLLLSVLYVQTLLVLESSSIPDSLSGIDPAPHANESQRRIHLLKFMSDFDDRVSDIREPRTIWEESVTHPTSGRKYRHWVKTLQYTEPPKASGLECLSNYDSDGEDPSRTPPIALPDLPSTDDEMEVDGRRDADPKAKDPFDSAANPQDEEEQEEADVVPDLPQKTKISKSMKVSRKRSASVASASAASGDETDASFGPRRSGRERKPVDRSADKSAKRPREATAEPEEPEQPAPSKKKKKPAKKN